MNQVIVAPNATVLFILQQWAGLPCNLSNEKMVVKPSDGEANPLIVVVTGTSSGFGKLSALAFAEQGHRVIATMRNPDRSGPLMDEARRRQVADLIDICRLDVTDAAEAEQVMETVIARYGKLDVLVNNAGYAQGGMIEEVPLDEWRAQMETNFFAVVRLTQLAVPHMRRQRSGLIVNVSSISGRMALPGFGPYSASKFALEGFSESLRLELAPFGIRVVLVEPGSYRTEIWDKGFDRVPEQPDSPYRPLQDAVFRQARHSAAHAPDPIAVAERIVALAGQTRPPLRHPMGRGIRAALAARSLLPWNWYERLLFRLLGERP